MLTELCQELRNWFDRERHFGTFEITGGSITAPFLVEGQYYRIIGSIFNDGVHQYGEDDLTDETFTGAVWALGIPKDVINLAAEIAEWRTKYEDVNGPALSPYLSESFFGDYSYSKGANGGDGTGTGTGWQSVFKNRLNPWRKI